MQLVYHSNPLEYRDHVRAFFMEREAENCLGLGIVDALINQPGLYATAYLWAVEESGHVVGAAWMTPPHPLGLTCMSDYALALLAEAAARLSEPLTAVVGPKAQADAFKELWTTRNSLGVKSTMEQRIYQLTKVDVAMPSDGQLRLAEASDLPLLEDWNFRYGVDCRLPLDIEEAKAYAVKAISSKSRYLWVVHGKPVAMASASGPTPSGIRVSWVYTPNELRGRGYASAAVAALSQLMLDRGRKFCFLYTDLANPTSNSIYQKIGYRPVCDAVHHIFTLADSEAPLGQR